MLEQKAYVITTSTSMPMTLDVRSVIPYGNYQFLKRLKSSFGYVQKSLKCKEEFENEEWERLQKKHCVGYGWNSFY